MPHASLFRTPVEPAPHSAARSRSRPRDRRAPGAASGHLRGPRSVAGRRAARRTAGPGNVDGVKAQHRDARSFRWIEDAWQDAVHGLRLLLRSPIFTATAALSLAIGIGANTAIFTVANALLFRPPAGITDPSELVVIGSARGDGGVNPINHATYLEIARRTTTLSQRVRGRVVPARHGDVLRGQRTLRRSAVGP